MNDSQSDPLSRQEFSLNTLVHSDCSLLCKAVNFCYPRAVWPHREKKEWVKKKKCYRILIKVGPYAHKSHGGYLLVPGRLAGRRRVPNQIGLYEKSYCVYCYFCFFHVWGPEKSQKKEMNWICVLLECQSVVAKGQLISECLLDFLHFSKKPTKNLTTFCPRI